MKKLNETQEEVKEILNKDHNPRIKKWERISIYGTLLLIFLGGGIGFYEEDWGHIARAGSLIVMLGIFMAYKDFSSKISNLKSTFQVQMDLSEQALSANAPKAQAAYKISKDFYIGILDHSMDINAKFLKMELILVLIGTFIWGYGDFIMECMYSFKR